MLPAQTIALFLKPPVPGRVKTRLATDIGDEAACLLYYKLVSHVIDAVFTSTTPLAICHDGNQDDLPASWIAPAWRCLQQQGDDLGQRMAAAFSRLFTDGCQQVVLIGSDIPGIDHTYLQQAFQQLASHDLVIGPAVDGGYCLIGFNRPSFDPSLFEQIPWSTGQVLQLTLSAAERAGLSVALLPPLRDLDTLEDLRELEREYGELKP